MRATLSFLTNTAAIAADWPTTLMGSTVEVLGWERSSRRVYFVEHSAASPVLYVIATTGEHAGNPLPLSGDLDRMAALRRDLIKLERGERRSWELHTRVVQRRGLKIAGMSTPVRKFALGLSVTRRNGGVAIGAGRATVTAYLRPRATLHQVFTVPGEPVALAVVSYCGVPAGVGFDKQTAILAVPSLQ